MITRRLAAISGLTLVLALLLYPAPVHADYAIEQLDANHSEEELSLLAQSFTTIGSGYVTQIAVMYEMEFDDNELRVYSGVQSPNNPSAALYSQSNSTLECYNCWVTYTLSSPLYVDAAAQYTFELSGANLYYDDRDLYSGGVLLRSGVVSPTNDLRFRVQVVETGILSVGKSVEPSSAAPGGPITYTLTFSNPGIITATDVVLTDIVPISVSVQSVASSGAMITATPGITYEWAVQDLLPGQGGVITVVGSLSDTLPAWHVLTNTAVLAASNAPGVTDTVTLAVTAPDIEIYKIAYPDPVVAGEALTYTLLITNAGNAAAANISVTDTLPASTTLQAIDQTDSAAADFSGIFVNTAWVDDRPAVSGDERLQLANVALGLGSYASRVFDALNLSTWTSLAWHPWRPYWKPLPDNGLAESAYRQGNADMAGSRVLLHLDDATYPFANTSGVGPDGVCIDCPSSGATGRFNHALAFDGDNDSVIIPDTVDPVRYAIELWVYPTGTATDTSFVLRSSSVSGTADSYSHLLGVLDGKFAHLVNDGQTKVVTGTTDVLPNQWYHLVGTAESGGDIKLYVNGTLEGRLDGIGNLWTGGDQYHLGAGYGTPPTSFFQGRIDEVAIYTRTLSAGEVFDRYLRGALRATFDVRSCDDPACAGEVFGGGHSEQSNASTDLPSAALAVPDNRYFQYRVTLESDHADFSPHLDEVTVGPTHYAVRSADASCTAGGARAFTCTLPSLGVGNAFSVTAWANVDPSALGTIVNAAGVSSTGDTVPTNNLAHVTTTAVSHVALHVTKHDDWHGGSDPVNLGSPMTYTLQVHNGGPSQAWSVQLTDTLPIMVNDVLAPSGWSCAWAGSTVTCTTPGLPPDTWPEVRVLGDAPSTGVILVNSAWVTATGSLVLTNASTLSSTESTTVEPLADLSVFKSADPTPAAPGQTLVYTVTVANAGPYTATGIVVTDTLPSGLSGTPINTGPWACAPGSEVVCTLGTLQPGNQATFQITVTAPLSGLLVNQAVVRGGRTDTVPDNNRYALHTTVRPAADLVVTKTAHASSAVSGDPLTYTIVITNTGPTRAGAVRTTFTVANADPVSIPWQGRATPYPSAIALHGAPGRVEDITVTLDTIFHEYPADLSVLLVGPNGGNVVLMSNAGGGVDVAGVSLTFHDTGIPIPVSDTLTSAAVYRPTNYGIADALPEPAPAGPYGSSLSTFHGASPNGTWQLYVYDSVDGIGGSLGGWSLQITTRTTDTVTIGDTLPAGVTGVTVSGLPSEWDCTLTDAALDCTADSIARGASTVVTLTATAPVTPGVITNTAWVASTTLDPDPASNASTATVTVLAVADLQISKSVSPGNTVGVGEPISYTLTVSNAGPSLVASTVVVTDQVPIELIGVAASGMGWTCDLSAAPLLSCTLDTSLPVNGVASVLVNATAPNSIGLVLTNTAGVASRAVDPEPLNNSAWVSVTLVELPILGLRADNDSPTVEGNVTWLTAAIAQGTNVVFTWDFGDGDLPFSGNPVSHTYQLVGTYTAVVTATNSLGTAVTTTLVTVVEPSTYYIYAPLISQNYWPGPDLVVEDVDAAANSVQIVVRNVGATDIAQTIANEFWVDLYIDPLAPPTSVNQTWQHMGGQGVVWGVTQPALPLARGQALTLALTPAGGAYYHPSLSSISWPLAPGTSIYAQVDSAHAGTQNGAILESHEYVNGPYNNIAGPVASTALAQESRPANDERSGTDPPNLLPRP